VKKAMLAAAVAAVAVAGVLVAVVVSSGGDSDETAPSSRPAPTPAGTTPTTAATTDSTVTSSPTAPVDTRRVQLPPPPGPGSLRGRTLIVGVVDDALAQSDPSFARAQVDLSRNAHFDAAMVSATWKRGQHRPPVGLVRVLRNVAAATRRDHMRLFVMVWHGLARDTPRNASERAAFADFAAGLVKAVPSVHAVVVGNEPNLSTFWKPQFGVGGRDVAARGYEDLLGRSYDAIKEADDGVIVLGGALSPRGADRPHGSRPTHSPTAFIRDLGAAYRASGRDRPLMDGFAIHPYMQFSRASPSEKHSANTSITVADYPKLVALLDEAFNGTAQPGARMPVYYTEFGVQTTVPAAKRSFYSDPESPGRADSVGFATQAAYYRQALALAYCQPTVKGLFVFHTFDEADYAGWQSGLYFADRTPKPSLDGFRQAVADLRAGKLTTCR
jgi:hypothetical protein